MDQQHGEEFAALPGEVNALGWQREQSCHCLSMYISQYHQIMSGQENDTLNIYTDGYVRHKKVSSQLS